MLYNRNDQINYLEGRRNIHSEKIAKAFPWCMCKKKTTSCRKYQGFREVRGFHESPNLCFGSEKWLLFLARVTVKRPLLKKITTGEVNEHYRRPENILQAFAREL